MAAMHEIHAPYTAAKQACYQCLNPNDVVVFDAFIEGEGTLVLCTTCVLDAAKVAQLGRARLKLAEKREKAKAEATP